jgi:flagellar motor component MotA
MKPSGEDVAQAIREWLRAEIKSVASYHRELGQFFFGVSTASLGALVFFKKLDQTLQLTWSVSSALVCLFSSALIAIVMVIPTVWLVDGDVDLFDEHQKRVRQTIRIVWAWFAVWVIGVLVAICSVITV